MQKAIDAGREIRGLAACKIIHLTIGMVDARILGTPAERISEKLILNFGQARGGFEWLAIKLREAETTGAAADIAERSHAVMDEDGEKIAEVKIRMADGVEAIAHGVC